MYGVEFVFDLFSAQGTNPPAYEGILTSTKVPYVLRQGIEMDPFDSYLIRRRILRNLPYIKFQALGKFNLTRKTVQDCTSRYRTLDTPDFHIVNDI